jgi:tetratricopeptide (TPR) repeat protein
MPEKLISCISLPPATITSVPIYDYVIAQKKLAKLGMKEYYPCCGKSICGGCVHSFRKSGNDKCPFCNSDQGTKTNKERVEEMMKRVAVNDAGAMSTLADCYHLGEHGLLQDREKALELWKQAPAALGSSHAHFHLGDVYRKGGAMKKAKFHYETAAMAGDEIARNNLGSLEFISGKRERALKHWEITASAGNYNAMHNLLCAFNQGVFSRESINSTLAAYNNSCVEMRSETRDAYIRAMSKT